MQIDDDTPGVTVKLVGSGVTTKSRYSFDFALIGEEKVNEALAEIGSSWNWEWALEDWYKFVLSKIPQIERCPGHNDDRCCKIWAVDDGVVISRMLSCRGGRWRELQDVEWFYAEFLRLYEIISQMVAKGDASGAARFAIELGERINQLETKWEIEPIWETGRKIRRGLEDRREWANDERRQEAEARRMRWQSLADDIWAEKPNAPKTYVAAAIVRRGKHEGMTADTIRMAIKKPAKAG